MRQNFDNSAVLSDEQIVEEVKKGKTELFEKIMRRYNQQLYRIAISYSIPDDECEDILQQTYLKAYENLNQFENRAKFSTWLIRILINECLHNKRNNNRMPKVEFPKAEGTLNNNSDQTPEAKLIQSDMGHWIETAIKELPENLRSVFIMREMEEISVKDTAEYLGLSEENVKVRFHRAKELLKQEIKRSFNVSDIFTFLGARCNKVTETVMRQITSSANIQ